MVFSLVVPLHSAIRTAWQCQQRAVKKSQERAASADCGHRAGRSKVRCAFALAALAGVWSVYGRVKLRWAPATLRHGRAWSHSDAFPASEPTTKPTSSEVGSPLETPNEGRTERVPCFERKRLKPPFFGGCNYRLKNSSMFVLTTPIARWIDSSQHRCWKRRDNPDQRYAQNNVFARNRSALRAERVWASMHYC